MREINAETKVCYVIGSPVHHSLSPQLHNAGYRALAIDHLYVFLAAEVSEANLGIAINGMRAIGVRGISVTVPHKEKVMQYLDSIDEIAAKIGAVNTIVNSQGKLKGFNTDWLGIIGPIEKLTQIEGKRVAVLGAGGAARAAAFGMKYKKGVVTIFNRTVSKAEALAKEFGVDSDSLEHASRLKDFDIIINCTTVGLGLSADESPVPPQVLKPSQIIFDTVYGPLTTKLVSAASSIGCRVIEGTEMLLFQGLEQFDFYTEKKAPEDAIRKELNQILRRPVARV